MNGGLTDIESKKLRNIFFQYTDIEKVILYGSRAKGNYRPFSDVDITLIGNTLTHDRLNKLSIDIDDLLLPYQFDISIFHKLTNSDLIEHINRVGIVFYKKPMSEWMEYKDIEKSNWSEWIKFPDPRNGDYLYAPFGKGVYQLRNNKTFEYVLFGKSKNLAKRMTSLLPSPYGCGTRNKQEKRDYVLENICNIEYRTVPFLTESEMKKCEDILKLHKIHIFNT